MLKKVLGPKTATMAVRKGPAIPEDSLPSAEATNTGPSYLL